MITKIKKIELIGLKKEKDAVMSLLQRLGIVELVASGEKAGEVSPRAVSESTLVDLEDAILFLSAFAPEEASAGLIKLKPLVRRSEVSDIISRFDHKALLEKVSRLKKQHNNLIQHKEKVSLEIHHLTPWRKLEIPLSEVCPTHKCGVVAGIINERDYDAMSTELAGTGVETFFEILHRDGTNMYCVLLHMQKDFDRIEPVLKKNHFGFVTLGLHKATVKERLFELRRELMVFEDQLRDIKEELRRLSAERFNIMVVYDHLRNIARREDAFIDAAKQEFTFAIRGWIREKDIRKAAREISKNFSGTAIFISDPAKDDDIPIALENPPAIRPFEVVTNLYGQPLYNGLDPTMLLAPFFAISFGFCIMDAGYGLVLLGIMVFFLSKKAISAAGKKFLRLFLYMSLSAIFAGIITGSFFGDLVSRLPGNFDAVKSFQRSLTVFDPAKDSLKFLGFTLALGFVQIWTGVFIKFLRSLKFDPFTALILDLPTLCVQTSLLLLTLIFAKALPGFLAPYVLGALVVSAALIIFYQLVMNKEISLKIFWSIFGIYSVITGNFLADTLSFSRIFALGLTGGLLGMAINTMLFPKWPVNSILSFTAFVLVLIALFGAHMLNLALSVLGAYVHTSRLQYLEFFTKFFESGGRQFRPFREETKYAMLADEK